jgi:hypothetical protein
MAVSLLLLPARPAPAQLLPSLQHPRPGPSTSAGTPAALPPFWRQHMPHRMLPRQSNHLQTACWLCLCLTAGAGPRLGVCTVLEAACGAGVPGSMQPACMLHSCRLQLVSTECVCCEQGSVCAVLGVVCGAAAPDRKHCLATSLPASLLHIKTGKRQAVPSLIKVRRTQMVPIASVRRQILSAGSSYRQLL